LAIGFGLGYGHDSSRIGKIGTKSQADSYSGGLYASFLPVKGAFIDGVVGLGTLSFDSRRIITATGDIAYGKRDGDQLFGSITAGVERRGERWLISPYGRIGVTRSTLDRFTEVGGGPYALAFDKHTVRTLTGALGLRGDYAQPTAFGSINPRFRVEYTHDFEGGDDATLSYADWIGGPSYRVAVSPLDRDLTRVELGLDFHVEGGLKIGLDYDNSLSANSESHGVRVSLQSNF
jgi:outer membrane autotransporter protein